MTLNLPNANPDCIRQFLRVNNLELQRNEISSVDVVGRLCQLFLHTKCRLHSRTRFPTLMQLDALPAIPSIVAR